jgi:hypothetical protein
MDVKKDGQKFSQPKFEQKLLNSPKMDDDQFELSSQWFVGGLVVAVVLIGSGWIMSHRGGSTAASATTTDQVAIVDTTSQTAAVMTTGDALTINDQAAGGTVAIASMSFDKTSWVAVRDAKTHWILGARRFDAGQKTGEVVLLKKTVAGGKYEGVIYTADGDKAFDLHKDTLVDGVSSAFSAN